MRGGERGGGWAEIEAVAAIVVQMGGGVNIGQVIVISPIHPIKRHCGALCCALLREPREHDIVTSIVEGIGLIWSQKKKERKEEGEEGGKDL